MGLVWRDASEGRNGPRMEGMNGIPDILSSAQTVLNDGFSRLNRAANEIVGGTLGAGQAGGTATGAAGTDSASLRPQMDGTGAGTDPLAAGLVDAIRAQVEVGAGAALVHAYNRSMDDLLRMLDPTTDRDRDGDQS